MSSAGDGTQFNTKLTGLKTSDQREVFDEVDQSDEEDNDSDDEEDDLNGAESEQEEEECPVSCDSGKSSRHLNKMMESKIKISKERMIDKSDNTTMKHYYRDEHLVSTKLEDYLSQFELTWDPLKIMKYSKN